MEVYITSFVSKAWYCSEGAPQTRKSELCLYVCHDRYIWLTAFFGYFFASLLLTLLHSGAIPPLVVKTRVLDALTAIQHFRQVVLVSLHYIFTPLISLKLVQIELHLHLVSLRLMCLSTKEIILGLVKLRGPLPC